MKEKGVFGSGRDPLNVLLVGVGGQGTILASNVLADLGLQLGYDVKKAEVHGMSQRGGSVVSQVRIGTEVFAPIIPAAETDILIAFEKMETARYVERLRPGGIVLVNDYSIIPLTVTLGEVEYPADEDIRQTVSDVQGKLCWVDGIGIAEKLGNARIANVVLIGALSALLEGDSAPWLAAIEARVPPKALEQNRRAFLAGREAI